MQTCYNCGQQVADEVLICPNCGALVRRYTSAPPRADAQEETQPPYAQTAAPQPGARRRVYTDANGKLRLSGGVKAWFIIMAVLCGYLAFGFACLLFVYHNQQVYSQIFGFLAETGTSTQITQMIGMFDELMRAIGQSYGFIALLLAASVLKLAAGIWFLCAKRRRALTATIVLCGVLAVLLFVFGYTSYALLAAADGVVTALLLLRKDRAALKK